MPVHRVALRTADDRWTPALPHEVGHSPVEVMVMRHGLTAPTETASAPIVEPIVNHGRWLVRCPFCPSAAYAARDDPRFYCVECLNAGTGKWLPVRWPADHAEIEALLGARPDRHLRNLIPGETVADVAAQNRQSGVI